MTSINAEAADFVLALAEGRPADARVHAKVILSHLKSGGPAPEEFRYDPKTGAERTYASIYLWVEAHALVM